MKKSLLALAIVGTVGLGLLGSSAFAQETNDTNNPMDTLVQKIATKFNLNESDVQAVFDEAHSEIETKIEADQSERLSTLVSEGKITEEQKSLILNKQKEMKESHKSNLENMKNLTPEERKSQMEAKRTELDTWAQENGIDPQYLMPHGGPGPRHSESPTN